jgi:hypothetical protein
VPEADITEWPVLIPSTAEDPRLLKTGFFRQVSKGAENAKEKNASSALWF